MKKNVLATMMLTAMFVATVQATPISIYDVQYTMDISGDSPYAGQTVDCDGGVVINKWVGGSTKLTLWDPAHATGWGGIIAKAFAGEFDSIQVGDWVSFTSVLVEERGGNTQLSFETGAGINIDSSDNMLPDALDVTASSFSEQYESMKVKVSDVTITAEDLGRYGDNYNLQNGNGDYWGADYMNIDAGGLYHPLVEVGNTFESVSGIIEHKISGDWDYYQLLTTGTSDFVVPEPATMVLLASGAILLRKRRDVLQSGNQ
jgi:hypothetical protein